MLKDFINEACLDFMRMENWKRVLNNLTITLDGSGSYSLSTLLAAADKYFVREYKLIIPYGEQVQVYDYTNTRTAERTEFTKYNYDYYQQLSDKAYTWAIDGDTIYIVGNNGDLTLRYFGDKYPLSADADTNSCLTYYPDAIKNLAALRFLDYINEDPAVIQRQEIALNNKVALLKRSEKIGEHSGKFTDIYRK